MKDKAFEDATNFRKHTCEDCGWAWHGDCRRNTFGSYVQGGENFIQFSINCVNKDDPACPGFVSKKQPPEPGDNK